MCDYIYIYKHTHMYINDAMILVIGNEHGYPSSKPG